MRFGVLGSGPVGQVLARGLKAHGYEVRIGSRTPAKLAEFSSAGAIPSGTFADVAAWAEALVLAVLGRGAEEVLKLAGRKNLSGKVVMDTTNPISDEPPEDGVIHFFTGPNDSLMERLQKAFPDARFVKAFSSVGNAFMVGPSFPGGKTTMFYCGNDAEAKRTVARIIEQFDWEPADMGKATAARAIEPLCQLWCIPGFLENRLDPRVSALATLRYHPCEWADARSHICQPTEPERRTSCVVGSASCRSRCRRRPRPPRSSSSPSRASCGARTWLGHLRPTCGSRRTAGTSTSGGGAPA